MFYLFEVVSRMYNVSYVQFESKHYYNLQIQCLFFYHIFLIKEQIKSLKTAIDVISNLTLSGRGSTLDVRIRRLKSIPALKESKIIIYNGYRSHNIGIEMKQTELTKTFMMICNLNNHLVSWFLYKYFSALRVNCDQRRQAVKARCGMFSTTWGNKLSS